MKANSRSRLGSICVLSLAMALPIAAKADPVTFTFTGNVDSSSGAFAAASSTISGTYTFDYAAADPLLSSGSLSDPSSGVTLANLVLGGPLPPSVVFTASFTSGGLSYTSPLTTAIGVLDLLGIGAGTFQASDSWVLADGSGLTDSISLFGPNVFNATGLPTLGADSTSLGQLVDGSGMNGLTFHLTTLVQEAPELDPASSAAGITLLLSAAVVLRSRRPRRMAAVKAPAIG